MAAERDRQWSEWMRDAQAGDAAAYERLLRAVLPWVRGLLRRAGVAAADVEDVAQDALLTVHRVRHTYDPARPFRPWLAAIVDRRRIDALRRRIRVGRLEVSDAVALETSAAPAANDSVEGMRAEADVGALLRTLPARQRTALEAVKLRELSVAEAAAESGQSVSAVKVNVHRALKTLRALMKER
ncbi:MAG: sigma-70 family RNA polymerase sigma factor [Steroidobacteraceae bacterium]